MAKLSRVVQKVFGSAAGTDQRAVFGSLLAGTPTFSTDPTAIQSLSNYLTGWFGAVIDGNSPAIEDMNALQFLKSRQLAYLFQQGVAEWNAETPYYIGSVINVNGVIYRSLTDDNLNNAYTDTANWKAFSTDPVGTMKDFLGSTTPDGYVLADGKTIGASGSGGTERANADTVDLFTLLWTNYANTLLIIQDSTGAPTTRGASAAADFAALKRMPLPDLRGRVAAGKDDMGGTAASRLTATAVSPDGTTLGATGGLQTHTLTTAELASHNHTQNAHQHTIQYSQNVYSGGSPLGIVEGIGFGAAYANTSSVTPTNNPAGSGNAHNNTQPTFVVNKIIKL